MMRGAVLWAKMLSADTLSFWNGGSWCPVKVMASERFLFLLSRGVSSDPEWDKEWLSQKTKLA